MNVLKSLFAHKLPTLVRQSKWSPLNIANFIRNNLAKFANKQAIIERTINTFDHLYKSLEKQLEKTLTKNSSAFSENSNMLAISEIMNSQASILNQIISIGHLFQYLETILTYGILMLSNETKTLSSILQDLDECSRILDKFTNLHVVYKLICGVNYLSNLIARGLLKHLSILTCI